MKGLKSFTIALTVLALFSACTDTNPSETLLSEQTTDQEKIEDQTLSKDIPNGKIINETEEDETKIEAKLEFTDKYQLVRAGGAASCFEYEIHDQEGSIIETNEEIANKLKCLWGTLSFSPTEEYLLYDYPNQTTKYFDLKLFDLETKEANTLMSFNSTLDNLTCTWHENGKGIACVAINQTDYPADTKIFYLEIDETGQLAIKKNFPQKTGETVYYTCGSNCFPHDFWFEGDYIKYQGHEEIAPGKIFSVKFR